MGRSICSVIILLVITSIPIVGVTDEDDLNQISRIIQTFIFARRFEEAEPYVRKVLQRVPEELYFLSQLDIVLNGQGKYQEADELRNHIRSIWESKYKANWIAKGSPVAEATWARMIVSTPKYEIIGAEYFQPEVIGTSPFTITSFYKIIVLPKSKAHMTRVFKLEMSKLVEEFYVLRELIQNGGGRQIIPYGINKPQLQQLLTDAMGYLDAEQ